MKKLTVNVDTPYEILIEKGLLNKSGALIREVSNAKKVCLITDSNVSSLYQEKVESSLKKNLFDVKTFVFKAGEESKTTNTVIPMVRFMAENELTRFDLVVALGGGVTGDMAGFASAMYLRGIDYVQIPTSLLAQIDSSVGGKTAVDLPEGKNLCGAFHQPRLVIIDPDVLNSLSPHFFSDGMAEAIKAGAIKSKSLFERIENENAHNFIEDMIYECVDIKRKVVENDEKEMGERALLNFGHTIAHAIEKLYNFTGISHGEAVGIGMAMIAKIGEDNSITQMNTSDRIIKVLEKYNIKTSDSHSLEEIINAMNFDKKRTSSGIKLIMLESIGKSYIKPVKFDEINTLFGV